VVSLTGFGIQQSLDNISSILLVGGYRFQCMRCALLVPRHGKSVDMIDPASRRSTSTTPTAHGTWDARPASCSPTALRLLHLDPATLRPRGGSAQESAHTIASEAGVGIKNPEDAVKKGKWAGEMLGSTADRGAHETKRVVIS